MAKVKISLIVDGERCKTIEDIQENFDIMDMLEHLENKKLEKFLKNREYEEYLEAITEIDEELLDKEKILALCEIFDIEIDEQDIEDELKVLEIQNDLEVKSQEEVAKELPQKREEYLPKYEYSLKKLVVEKNENTKQVKFLTKTKKIILIETDGRFNNRFKSITDELKNMEKEVIFIDLYDRINEEDFVVRYGNPKISLETIKPEDIAIPPRIIDKIIEKAFLKDEE